MITGPLAGRWTMDVAAYDGLGNRFVPAGELPGLLWRGNLALNSGVNTVVVQLPTGRTAEERGTFLEHLVHETLHAVDLIRGVPATNGTLAHDAAAFIQQEGDVRRRTLAIMREIRLAGFRIPTPPAAAREVERDFRSGEDAVTYLESFVLSWMIRESLAREGVTGSAIVDLQTRAETVRFGDDRALMGVVDGLVVIYNPATEMFETPASVALQLMVRQRAVIERWRRLRTGAMQGDRETVLQQHAAALFPPGIAYSP